MPDIKQLYDIVGAGDGESQSLSRSASPERQRSQRSESGNGEISETLKHYRREYGVTSSSEEPEWQSTASSRHRGEESPEQHEYPTMWLGGSGGGNGDVIGILAIRDIRTIMAIKALATGSLMAILLRIFMRRKGINLVM